MVAPPSGREPERVGPRARARDAWRRSARPLAFAGLACLALSAWLLFPRQRGAARLDAPVRVVLLDASASAARCSSGWNLWARHELREEALAAAATGELLCVVRFAADVERLYPPAAPEGWLARLEGAGGEALRLRLAPPADLGSELDAALALVESALSAPGRAPGRVRLLGDGRSTGPDPTPRLARLAQAGVELSRRAPPAADLADLALVELRLPPAPAEGEPLAAAAVLELRPGAGRGAGGGAWGETRADLRVLVDSAAGQRAFELRVPLADFAPGPEAGSLRATVPIELGPAAPGRTLLTVRAALSGPGALRAGDPLPENDQASAVATAGGRRVAAAVASAADQPLLRAWLGGPERFPGLQWIWCTPSELPALASELDLVLSFDISHAELPATALAELVRAGGGWLFCGGWALLRDWSPAPERDGPSGLAALLPVDLGRAPGPERDVLLLVDGSGSMAGEPFELVKLALGELVAAALSGDQLSLRFFTSVLGRPQSLAAGTPAERRRALAELMRQRAPGGMTAILDSLEELRAERAPEARPMLVLLLTDGRDRNAFDLERRSSELRQAFAASGVELSAIAAGANADLDLLRAVVGPGGSLQVAADLRDLAELFQREVHRSRVRAGPDLRAVPLEPEALGALPPAADVLRAQLARPPAEWPPLERYARAELVPGASALWNGLAGEPLLAMHRVGAGLVAAWLSSPLPGWAPAWAGADDLLAPLLRALAGAGRERGGLRLEVEAGGLTLAGVPAHWPARVRALVYAPVLASAFDGSGREAELGVVELLPPFATAGPDPRHRRVAARPAFLARAPAGAALRVELVDPRQGELLGQVALRAPRPEELEPRADAWAGLEGLAEGLEPGRPVALGRERPESSAWGPRLLLSGLLLLALAALGDPFIPRRDAPRRGSRAHSSAPAGESKSL